MIKLVSKYFSFDVGNFRTLTLVGAFSLISGQAFAEPASLAFASWSVTYSLPSSPGLFLTYEDVAPTKIELFSSGPAGNYVDFFLGGHLGFVDWDAGSSANLPDGFASANFLGPLRGNFDPQPIPVFRALNISDQSVALTFDLSGTIFFLDVYTTLPFGYAGAFASFSLYGGLWDSLQYLGGQSAHCYTSLNCTGRVYSNVVYGPVEAVLAPGETYEFWIKDTSARTFAGAVPEAPTWIIMMMGFGMVGSALRRRVASAT